MPATRTISAPKRAIACYAAGADAAMDEDRRSGADQLGALGDRAAVIAVGGAGEGHAGGDRCDLGGVQVGDVDLAGQACGRPLPAPAG